MKNWDDSIRELLSGQGEAIPLFKVFMPESVMEPLREVLFSGYIGEGPRTAEFERRLAPWFGSENILALNNGTAAIHLALRMAGVEPGDEVISTPMTCVATNVPVLAAGARVVWADIDPWTGNIDPADVTRKISSKTKAIIPVHWSGYPCDLDDLNRIASDHGLKVIEDACHAFGATYHGRSIGSHSDFVCFSFQAIKEMTTVDGGALVCKSGADSDRGRLLRWYGIDRKANRRDFRCEEDIREFGYKYHMNDVAATIGLEQLKYVEANLAKHCANAEHYDDAFHDLQAVSPLRYNDSRQSAYWLYNVRVRSRRDFVEKMREAGIVVSQVHARNDKHTMFRESLVDLPGVDEFSSEQICIPVGWWLTEEEVTYIIDTIIEFDRSSGG